ncbi:hypothetical protein MOO44_02845 [Nicoliella spurrieriana]|uniref:Uncharacterized protein n=1 Tax=Nicoliella spurrieriana TaxID=2925830 RepID=A0A976RSU5_9LACO|nr:hypothetical protein [Nicoliella spurrieriana]UQS87116.1 hypothetical protein MOO44_02845 [Nicoliella spurrieriana]
MENSERKLIQEILNTVDVLYDFENTDDDNKEYTLVLHRQDNDRRPLEEVNAEVKKYFQEANFTYKEQLNPNEGVDIRVEIKR